MPCPLKISEAAALGMHSMGLLAARAGECLSSKAIAAVFQVSENHLSKVLHRLVKVGLLRSTRGPKGGFCLVRKPESVYLREVYEATEGPLAAPGCVFNLPDCDGRSCAFGAALWEANMKLAEYLSSTRLSDIAPIFERDRFQLPVALSSR